MDIEDFLTRRGIFPQAIQIDLGRDGLSATIADLAGLAESRLLEIDQRIEIVRHLLLIAQPRVAGRLEVTWQIQHEKVRPRVIQWVWARKSRRWIAWRLPDTQIHRHLRKTLGFRANLELSRALVSLLAHLLRLRTELLRSVQLIQMALKHRTAHDPFAEIDAALDGLARQAFQARLA